MTEYKTVRGQTTAELVEKKSRFIAYVRPVKTEEDALDFINEIKLKHWDARHNVYAYIMRESNIRRYSDDGEPHGTAGIPVLTVLQNLQLQDVVVVVTRYFGGTLLGTGGLVRAYSKSAQMALEKSGVTVMEQCNDCEIVCDYNLYGKISSAITENSGRIDDSGFGDKVKIKFHVDKNNFSRLSKSISEMTSGTTDVTVLSEQFYGRTV